MAAHRPEDDPPGLPPEWAGFVVPDDISELEPEIELLRREFPTAATAGRWRRLLETKRWQRTGLSGPLVTAILLVVLAFASLIFLLRPTGPGLAQARPLAHPTALPGAAGALLPDVALPVGPNDAVRLRNLRPAVLVIAPAACDCARLIDDVVRRTRSAGLQVLVIGVGADPTLPRNAPRDRVHAARDTGGLLASSYGARAGTGSDSGAGAVAEPTAIFVRSDGVVSRVLYPATPGAAVHTEIDGLAE
ncbi:MAG: hypothetical protein M3042_10505 [Actinomycetota bacterium]|nr:hypothetical protein [Actinomycetota bacterium]